MGAHLTCVKTKEGSDLVDLVELRLKVVVTDPTWM